ncbi:MAG: zf-HC2 domain-containing protein [Candidatus Eremiobacteraeota bacterium]|nr:zf-HC2 domain-containing protein [Candidatus Eremiobacteraeota bacterium]
MKITCNEAVKNLIDYLHRELGNIERKKIDEHLEKCYKCCDKFEFEEKLSDIICKQGGDETCPKRLKSNIIKLINEVE